MNFGRLTDAARISREKMLVQNVTKLSILAVPAEVYSIRKL
jgi:hypothetical protein